MSAEGRTVQSSTLMKIHQRNIGQVLVAISTWLSVDISSSITGFETRIAGIKTSNVVSSSKSRKKIDEKTKLR